VLCCVVLCPAVFTSRLPAHQDLSFMSLVERQQPCQRTRENRIGQSEKRACTYGQPYRQSEKRARTYGQPCRQSEKRARTYGQSKRQSQGQSHTYGQSNRQSARRPFPPLRQLKHTEVCPQSLSEPCMRPQRGAVLGKLQALCA
jgi:hypothetical protein